jgi:predicted nucleotidyltransferase
MQKRMRIEIPQARIETFCKRHGVKKLAFFGSVLRDDFDPEKSDVDVLIEFEPGKRIGYVGLGAMELELSEILGVHVDLRTPSELSRYFRDEVMATAEVQYAA